jgi:hypothetical protein
MGNLTSEHAAQAGSKPAHEPRECTLLPTTSAPGVRVLRQKISLPDRPVMIGMGQVHGLVVRGDNQNPARLKN